MGDLCLARSSRLLADAAPQPVQVVKEQRLVLVDAIPSVVQR